MKKSFIVIILLFFFIKGNASPGDTTIVQTFDFSWPRPSGLNPKTGMFVFPSFTNKTFEKVLMYYKLKCDPSQSPQCGEWDYLSYSNLFEHTGLLDSTQYSQLKYNYFNYSGLATDSLICKNSVSWNYWPYFQKYIVHDNTISFDSTRVGNLAASSNQSIISGQADGRSIFIWKAAELISSGLSSGNISGIRLNFSGIAATVNIGRLKIQIRQSAVDSVAIPASLDSLSLVYDKNTILTSNGWVDFQFNQPFFWDGISNLLIDFQYLQENNGIGLACNAFSFNCGVKSADADNYASFGLANYLNLPLQRFSMIDTAVTIALWQYGDAGMPYNGSAFEGVNAANARLLNSHLPWSNSNVFWDAGKNTYDRISKLALSSDFKGKWNHWAFTKNCQTGSMKIYLNGLLWQSGSGKIKLMDTIVKFIVGNALTYQNGYYKGSIDDFSIWDKELDITTIKQLMYNKLTTAHPNYQNLVYAYNLNEVSGNIAANISNLASDDAAFKGIINRNNFKGNRFKNFSALNYKPVVIFEKGVYQSHVDSLFVPDSVKALPVMVVVYGDSLHPTVATDTLYKYLPYYRYTYNALGVKTDSVLIPGTDTLFQKNNIYYGPAFEIIRKWELGRFITPYGINLSLGNGWTWIYDVTDFASLLKDTVYLQAGNFQELLDLKFAFIEGTPARNVIKIRNVWQGNFNLSNFDTKVVAKTITIDTLSEKMVKLRTTVTGHGMGATNNCAEFCPNIHKLKAGGQLVKQWQIIQPCALNPLYPQGGTWIYDRAAWCPGMAATMQEFELASYISNNQLTIDYDIDYDPDGNYVTESQLVTYSAPNFSTDAALTEIISPNNYELLGRFNPICGKPEIRIRNNGKNTLTSLSIDYGFENGSSSTYQWSGSLGFLETADIKLPALDFSSLSASSGRFWAEVKLPNGMQDQYAFNNKLSVAFNTVDVNAETQYQMYFLTNHKPNETSWKVEDANGVVFAQNDPNMTANTWYTKMFNLVNGCYKITITDAGDDGLRFWANMPPNGNGSAGQAILEKNIGSGFLTAYTFQADFGREISYSFIVNDNLGVKNTDKLQFSIYPNPATDVLHISSNSIQQDEVEIRIYNSFGELVKSEHVNKLISTTFDITINELSKGLYVVQLLKNNDIITASRFVKI